MKLSRIDILTARMFKDEVWAILKTQKTLRKFKFYKRPAML